MASLVYLVNENQIAKIKNLYQGDKKPLPTPYVEFFASNNEFSITLYQKKNQEGYQKLLLQGDQISHEGKIWEGFGAIPCLKESKPSSTKTSLKLEDHINEQIGSDEVGTGDFFGPVCVVASYVPKEKIALLEELGITDSKKMNDDYILKVSPRLIQEFDYSSLSLDNEKYNEVHSLYNMNAIKAKMHNQCLLNLAKRYPNAKIYQDQFTEKNLYFSYLKKEKEICKNIIFATKGESKFSSVALSSVLARYSFLSKMKKLSSKYDCEFPLGAGSNVDEFALHFVKKYGLEELSKVAKTSFKNYEALLAKLG